MFYNQNRTYVLFSRFLLRKGKTDGEGEATAEEEGTWKSDPS